MQITIERKERHFIARLSGRTTDKDLLEYADIVMDAARRFDMNRVLLDERDIIHESDMLGGYMASEHPAVTEAAARGLRVALIGTPANRIPNKAFETLMRNRSVNCRLFEDFEEAEAWLLA